MPRASLAVTLVFLAACSNPLRITDDDATIAAAADGAAKVSAASRQHVSGDVYHYTFDLRVGTTPNAIVRVHRVVREAAPWRPRPTPRAIMLLHGDFADFVTNFVPVLGDPASPVAGLAPYLSARGIDVWGVDRRWTLPGSNGDISDFGGMSVDQELGDIVTALGFARAARLISDGDAKRIVLGGFSHGAELTYAYAASGGRHVSAIAALDVYYDIAPEDADAQAFACANAQAEYAALAQGTIDAPNQSFIQLGADDRSDPNGPSQLFGPPYTNQEALFTLVGQTYAFVPYTPLYHLAAPLLDDQGNVSGLRESSETAVSAWFAAAPPHQSQHEAADLDAIWCAKLPRPSLANIDVPLLYIGAAGAFGAHGLYTTTRVSSTDVTTRVVHRFGAERAAEDFGHGDLLYALDAPSLAWKPLADWVQRH